MKILIPLASTLLLAACVSAPPRMEVPLQAQAPAPMGMEGPSSIGYNIIDSRHSNYANQPNEVNNALWGGAIGAGVGNAIGHDAESTVYGAATGILGGYYGSKLIR
jgi:flagellar L-ring protein (basal body L-ring protein)